MFAAARRHTNALSTKAVQIRMALRHHERNFATRSAHTLKAIISHDTANHPAYQRHALYVSRCAGARRHANALSTKAVQIHMALRHHERNFATRSAHTLQAIVSHDTTNHPAHQRHAAFTPAPVARRHANALPTKTSQIRMALRHHERNFATRSAPHYI